MQTIESANRRAAPDRIDLFVYEDDLNAPSAPEWEGWGGDGSLEEEREQPQDHLRREADAVQRADLEKRMAEETRRSFESGRERGKLEGSQSEREVQANALRTVEVQRAAQAARLIESFAQERDRYLQAVEHEVVKLALAIAARILRREAQMDPLLLTGAVRVSLGQLSGTTQVRLKVPPAELDLWAETIATLPKLALKPAVVAGEGMLLGDCLIETELGSVDLGIRGQLAEIERGFFDRTGGRTVHESASAKVSADPLEESGL